MVRRNATLEEKQKSSAYNTAWKKRHRLWGTEIANKLRNREKEYARLKAGTGEGYRALWLNNCKYRAKKKGVPFDLTLEDLVFPETCPILGIPLVMRAGSFHDNSPSIDRMIPEEGYVKGNVQIISYRANRLKAHGTLDDLRKIVAWMEKYE